MIHNFFHPNVRPAKKEKTLKLFDDQIKELKRRRAIVEKIPSGSICLLKTKEYYWQEKRRKVITSVVVPRVFNAESIRCEVLASDREVKNWRPAKGKEHWETYKYGEITQLKPVEVEDLPLYVGLGYNSPAMAKALKGKLKHS
jgi:hypothetical protein